MFLWISLTDLLEFDNSALGSPLALILNEDEWPEYAVCSSTSFDQAFIIIECKDEERAHSLATVLRLLGKRVLGRPVRCKVTRQEPGPKWRRVMSRS